MPWTMEQKSFCIKAYNETKSFKNAQARYRINFNFDTFQNKTQIFKLVKNFKAHSIYEDRRTTCSTLSRFPITIGTPSRYVRVLSIILHLAFNSAFT